MSGAPWLSVIVPVYNGERYLAAALESVVSQQDAQVEIIVSDDGSTDSSPRVIEGFAERGQIVPLSGPGQGNWVANSNRAVAKARGRFLAFLHQDDLWLPGRIETIRGLLRLQPDRGMWLSPTLFIGPDGRTAGTWRLPFRHSKESVPAQEFLERLLVQNFIGMPTPVFRRNAFEDVGGLDESLWFTADWDLWLKLGARDGVGISWRPTAAFRLHTHSQTMSGAAAYASMRAQIDTVRYRHIDKIADPAARAAVERASRFSAALNESLAAAVAGQRADLRELRAAFLGLGAAGCYRFLRDSRFVERTMARLRLGLARSQ